MSKLFAVRGTLKHKPVNTKPRKHKVGVKAEKVVLDLAGGAIRFSGLDTREARRIDNWQRRRDGYGVGQQQLNDGTRVLFLRG